ncbi:MAG: TonB-dependent siderophore receptor [Woeseia sp.]
MLEQTRSSRPFPFAFFPLASLLSLTLAGTAMAQKGEVEQIDEIVVEGRLSRYSALKSDVPIMETARSVSIEDRQQLLDKGAINLADSYLYSSGVTGEAYGFATRGDWVKVRGLDVPEYRDSLQALFSNYNNTRPDIYTIEQVEILKGPASVLFGQGSPGGIVNVVSKTPRLNAQSEVELEYGNFDRIQVAADLNGSFGRNDQWLYRFVGVHRKTDTQVDFIYEDALVVAPSLTWRPAEETNITLLANFQQTDSDAGAQFLPIYGTLLPAPNGRFIEPDTYLGEPGFNRYDTETRSLTLLADHQLNAAWSIEATARYTDGEADYRQAWPAFIGGDRYAVNPDGSLYENGVVPRTFYDSFATSEQKAVDLRARTDFQTGNFGHQMLIGVQHQDVTTENDRSYAYALGYDFATGGPDGDLGDAYWINVFDPVYGAIPPDSVMAQYFFDAPAANTTDLGLYVSDQVSYQNWRFTFGLRADKVETDNGSTTQKDDALSTSVGFLYQFDNGFAPYASYAESFEPVAGIDTITGDAFKPQDGRQYEAGLKYLDAASGSYVTFAWFDIEQSNLGNPNSLVNAPSQQEGVARIRGVELEGILTLGEFRVEGNLSRLDTEDPNGFHLASVPEIQASAWIGYRPRDRWQGFKAGIGVRYTGESHDGADGLETPAYTLGDVMVGYQTERWDFALNVRNVTDRDYMATCLARGDCFPGENRTVVGRAVMKF